MLEYIERTLSFHNQHVRDARHGIQHQPFEGASTGEYSQNSELDTEEGIYQCIDTLSLAHSASNSSGDTQTDTVMSVSAGIQKKVAPTDNMTFKADMDYEEIELDNMEQSHGVPPCFSGAQSAMKFRFDRNLDMIQSGDRLYTSHGLKAGSSIYSLETSAYQNRKSSCCSSGSEFQCIDNKLYQTVNKEQLQPMPIAEPTLRTFPRTPLHSSITTHGQESWQSSLVNSTID